MAHWVSIGLTTASTVPSMRPKALVSALPKVLAQPADLSPGAPPAPPVPVELDAEDDADAPPVPVAALVDELASVVALVDELAPVVEVAVEADSPPQAARAIGTVKRSVVRPRSRIARPSYASCAAASTLS